MAGPIGYVPPANPYAAMPIESPKFTGINPLPAQAAAMQAMAPIQQKIQQSDQIDDQAKKAAQFQGLLNQGVAGMQSYIGDVSKENPELGTHFSQELQTMSPFLQTLKGKDLNDAVFGLYDSWNGRYNGAKMSKVMGNPDATDTDVFSAYGQSGGTPDKMMSAYLTNKKTDENTKYLGAKIDDLKAHADYLKQRPELMQKLEEIKNEGKVRAARIRSKASGNGTSYQTSLRDSMKSMQEIDRDIATLQSQMVGVDPMEAHFNGLDTQMHQLRSEKLRVQGWINKAHEKGAKIDDNIDIDPAPGITAPSAPIAPAAPGAAPQTAPSPAGPGTGDISSSAPDASLSAYYKTMTGQDPSPKDLEDFRAALRQDKR